MDENSPFFAVATILTAVASAYFLAKYINLPTGQGRCVSLDGLRGYLAIGVFVHHSSCWYPYIRVGVWGPGSKFYDFLGYGCVAFFFMITGFLFFSKILDADRKPIDWLRLYVSRALRLIPLYAFMMGCMLLIVACLTGFSLRQPLGALLESLAGWAVYQVPNVNGVKSTSLIVGGVTWTLPFEWFFYMTLPLLALLVRGPRIAPIGCAVLGVAAAATVVVVSLSGQFHIAIPRFSMMFAGGMLAAVVARNPRARTLACSKAASVAALACVGVAMSVDYRIDGIVDAYLVFMTVAFVIIACGNSLFGVLTTAPSRLLGEISYSSYLLHGLFLFVMFRFVVGFQNASRLFYLGDWLDPWAHWVMIIGCTPLLILACCATFRWIETPFIRQTANVTAWLRSLGSMTASNRGIPDVAMIPRPTVQGE